MYIYIPQEILQLLLFPKELLSIPNYKYFINFIWCLLVTEGKKTTRNIYRYCFFYKKHLASWERFLSKNQWDCMGIMKQLFYKLLELFPDSFIVHGALLLAYDTSLIAKNSEKILGIQKWNNHSGNADKGEYIIGHHWGILGLIGSFLSKRFLCFPLIFWLISGKSNPCQWICDTNGIAKPMNFWNNVHAALFQFADWACKYTVRVVVDAYFSNKSFIQPLLDRENPIHVITKLKSNAVGYLDPEKPKTKKQGRPRKKGQKVKILNLIKTEPTQLVSVCLYGEIKTIEVVVKDLLLLDLDRKVRVVVAKIGSSVTALISTDMTLTPAQIIEIYSARFSIEVAIRDMKQHLGLGDYQHQSLLPTFRFVHLVAVAYSIGKIALLKYSNSSWLHTYDNQGDTPWTSELSFKRLRICLRRFSLEKLVFSKTALDQEVEKNTSVKDAILSIAS
ncbi:IS701 family transposase [Thermotalea metallivorans]|uniref:IS701 family transposase n=1 Tax=Thermotalea metallivorans TaxID=520762 RepID=UPI001FA7FAE4|nr:transposase [Thermotalea metallivorans]